MTDRPGALLWSGGALSLEAPSWKGERTLSFRYHYVSRSTISIEYPLNSPLLQFDSAINRYLDEIRRILSVLEKELTDNKKEWLVGDRISYADLSFVVWNWVLELFPLEGWQKEYPKVAEWDRKLNERPSVALCLAQRTAATAQFES